MFDANMRYLAKGREFFAKVHYMDGGKLHSLGVQAGDIILCKMLSDEHENPTVLFKLKSGGVEISDERLEHSWIVYEGRVDGSGFIDDESKRIAMSMIKDKK